MAGSSGSVDAPRDRPSKNTLHLQHAIVSLMEELEAVDWYRQRADDCDDEALKEISDHSVSRIYVGCHVLMAPRDSPHLRCRPSRTLRRHASGAASSLGGEATVCAPCFHGVGHPDQQSIDGWDCTERC